jgi:CBS domain-containing protein
VGSTYPARICAYGAIVTGIQNGYGLEWRTPMLLNQICTPAVTCCTRETTALEAARIMREQHAGDLVVVDQIDETRIPVGVITDRDIVVQILGNEMDPATTPVGKVMQTPVVTAHETEDSSEAIARMRAHGVRRLPVVGRSGTLVGIVSLDDLLKHLASDTNALLEIVARQQDRERRTRR